VWVTIALFKNAIIDKDCRIGNDVKIVGGSHLPDVNTDLLTVKDGIVVIKKEAVIPNGFYDLKT
jgi:glucose-1-phosphate adenylyltransferase